MDSGLNVTRLQIKNFLSISDAEIKPGKITQIVGANNAGKTTILRALETAVKGSSDGSLVKHGESQAEIVVEFSDGLSIRRRIGSDGKQDVKVSKNEMEAKAPQGLLNSLFESSAFNPLELLEPKRRAEAMLQAIPAKVTAEAVEAALAPLPIPLPPIDFNAHGLKVVDQLHDYFYARRAEANKNAKVEADRLKYAREGLPAEPERGSKTDEAAAAALAETNAQLRTLQERVQIKTLREQQLRENDSAWGRLEDRQTEITQQLKLLYQEQNANSLRLREYGIERANLEAEIKGFEADAEQARKLNDERAAIEAERTKNANRRAWEALEAGVKNQESRAADAKALAEDFDRCVDIIRTRVKTEMMNGCQMPVPGITFSDGKFYFGGSAIENLSTSMAMKLAVGLARALAGKARVICLDGAEALDDETYCALKAEIENDGFTYFVTKVGMPFTSEGDTVVKMQQGVAQ